MQSGIIDNIATDNYLIMLGIYLSNVRKYGDVGSGRSSRNAGVPRLAFDGIFERYLIWYLAVTPLIK